MVVQVLAPGVQHHQDADRRAEPLRVGRDFAQRRRRRGEEQFVQRRPVGQCEFGDPGRQREHDVEVVDGQQELRLALEPAGAGRGLAGGQWRLRHEL